MKNAPASGIPVWLRLPCFALAFSSCTSLQYIDLGPGGQQAFDSSAVSLRREDRLAFLELLNYRTTHHTAGSMSSKVKINSIGWKDPRQSVATFGWVGQMNIESADQSVQVQYHAALKDEITGDFLFSPQGWLSSKRRNEEHQGLQIRGVIHCRNDSAFFGYSIGESGLSRLMNGYLIFGQDTAHFRPIYREVLKKRTVYRLSYGYGIFLNDMLLGAIDFDKKPAWTYLRKDLHPTLKNMVIGFLFIAGGNSKIVPRRSIALKRWL